MFLIKRGSTSYLAFKNKGGKQIRVSTRCHLKSQALEFLRHFKLEQYLAEPDIRRRNLSEFVREFVRHSPCQHSPKTTASYLTSLNEFQKLLGDRELRSYGIRDVEKFILAKRTGRSLHSVRSYHTHLAASIEQAKSWGYVDENPFRRVKRIRPPEGIPLFLTREQFQ